MEKVFGHGRSALYVPEHTKNLPPTSLTWNAGPEGAADLAPRSLATGGDMPANGRHGGRLNDALGPLLQNASRHQMI